MAAAFVAGSVLAQSSPSPTLRASVDPYTRGSDMALARAGYVSLGPFDFGADHTTTDIEQLLGDEPLCWIETAHFRIGCAVSELKLRGAERAWREQIKRELKQLRKRLPNVRSTKRTLDPWLRAHLIAQRLEDCYAAVLDNLGATDATFPQEPMDSSLPDEYLGDGPYLGMEQKFAVLIVGRGASLARYTRAYMGGIETMEPYRFHAADHGQLAFAIAEESSEGQMKVDQALHAQIAYNVSANLYNGYRTYGHELPPWLIFGLAHFHARQVSPRYPTYEVAQGAEVEDSPFWKWDERARGLMKFQVFEPLDDFVARPSVIGFGMEQHIQAWSFVEFLMTHKRAETMAVLHELKDPFHQKRALPTPEEMRWRQDAAFRDTFGCGVDELLPAWREHLEETKRRRR